MIEPGLKGQFDVRPPLTPTWQRKLEQIRAEDSAGQYVPSRVARCINEGLPLEMSGPSALFEFLYSPGRVTITDAAGWVRRIYLGRPLPSDPDLSFQGSSVGHWEGRTLVVETNGLDPGDEMVYGLPIGKDAHLLERMYLKDKHTLHIDFELSGSQALRASYRFSHEYQRSEEPILEYDCAQNNRDTVDPATGKSGFDLTPPP